MDRALGYLAMARKGGLAELGEEPVGAAARAGKAVLVIVASDASEHTWRRARNFVEGTPQLCLRVPFTKLELGQAVGRTELALAAMTDTGLALALAKALPPGTENGKIVEALAEKSKRAAQRRAEAKAHQKNRRAGHTGSQVRRKQP